MAVMALQGATQIARTAPGLSESCSEGLMCLIVAMVILRLEPQHYAGSCKRLLRKYAPEVAGLAACLLLAAAMRARSDGASPTGQDEEAWAAITASWPILLTADTLLSLQAMLRLVILVSVTLRADSGGPTPLSGEAAALWLFAGTARVAILPLSEAYLLDGPLGGPLPVACEVAALPLLLALSRGLWWRRAPLTAAAVVAAAACFASRHYLTLADAGPADCLFILAHCFDVLAAFAFLLRTLLLDGGPGKTDVSVGFTHVLMPVQQGLSAYYFLQAFDAMPALVGAGLPFEVLQIGDTAGLGALLGALALHLAESSESRDRASEAAVGVAQLAA